MNNERLDETIDRVAAGLTAVPADPGFSARLRDRLPQQTHHRTRWILAAATAAAVVVAAVIVVRFSSARPEEVVSDLVSTSSALRDGLAELRQGGLVSSVGTGLLSERRDWSVSPMILTDSEGEAPAVEPGALTVSPLVVAAVSMPPVVAIAPLEVPNLEIAEIGAGLGSKEPQ
jgi:hypothetical protein